MIENGIPESWDIERELGFDRDFDGTWLVWVERPDRAPPGGAQVEGDPTGSIVVKDVRANAFLDQLIDLISDPESFSHEPAFDSEPPDES